MMFLSAIAIFHLRIRQEILPYGDMVIKQLKRALPKPFWQDSQCSLVQSFFTKRAQLFIANLNSWYINDIN